MGFKVKQVRIHVTGTRRADVRFFFPPFSPRWEDLCALSHAAVKDSCHPVSGSNTHTRQRVKRIEAEGRAHTSGNAQLSKTRRRRVKTHEKEAKKFDE